MKAKLKKLSTVVFFTVLIPIVALAVDTAVALDTESGPLIGLLDGETFKEQDIFEWNETPATSISFLKANLKGGKWSDPLSLTIDWTWTYESVTAYYDDVFLDPPDYGTPYDPLVTTYSFSFPGWDELDVSERIGDWTLTTQWELITSPNPPGGKATIPFTVTPEPISSVLFLIGGTAIALIKHRRTKKSKDN